MVLGLVAIGVGTIALGVWHLGVPVWFHFGPALEMREAAGPLPPVRRRPCARDDDARHPRGCLDHEPRRVVRADHDRPRDARRAALGRHARRQGARAVDWPAGGSSGPAGSSRSGGGGSTSSCWPRSGRSACSTSPSPWRDAAADDALAGPAVRALARRPGAAPATRATVAGDRHVRWGRRAGCRAVRQHAGSGRSASRCPVRRSRSRRSTSGPTSAVPMGCPPCGFSRWTATIGLVRRRPGWHSESPTTTRR